MMGTYWHPVPKTTTARIPRLGTRGFGVRARVGAFLCCLVSLATEGAMPNPASAQEVSAPVRQYRGLWVDAFHDGFKTPAETIELVEHARRNHINTLFIEVRKVGDAYYRSKYEPAACDMAPGYDPLAHVLALCHDTSRGKQPIEVHAWIVVYRLARSGVKLPSGHVFERQPTWACLNRSGSKSQDNNLFVDPGVPGVIDHTAAVVADLVHKYDIDGIHLDYIRYPGEEWGYNSIALKRFSRLTGKSGRAPLPDDEIWSQFRRDQVTALVRRVYAVVKSIRTQVKVSVAAIACGGPGRGGPESDFHRSLTYRRYCQDWPAWLQEGIIDAMVLMNYKREDVADEKQDYRDWVQFVTSQAQGRHVVIGQGGFLQHASLSLRQLRVAAQTPGISGVVVYSYATPTRLSSEQPAFWGSLRSSLFETAAPAPRAEWLDYPRRGILAGRVLSPAGDGVDGATVTLEGQDKRGLKTDGSGFYALANLPTGRYIISASATGGKKAAISAIVTPGRVKNANLTVR